jgi:hypothetical protein
MCWACYRPGHERAEARDGGVAGAGELLRVDAELGLGVGGQRVAGGQLLGDVPGQVRRRALGLVDPRQLGQLRPRGLG